MIAAGIMEFQSTRPRGARLQNYIRRMAVMAFQSTRPRGARPDATP